MKYFARRFNFSPVTEIVIWSLYHPSLPQNISENQSDTLFIFNEIFSKRSFNFFLINYQLLSKIVILSIAHIIPVYLKIFPRIGQALLKLSLLHLAIKYLSCLSELLIKL